MKIERNKEITEMRKSGRYTLRQIGEKFNLSRQRIKQIIDRENVFSVSKNPSDILKKFINADDSEYLKDFGEIKRPPIDIYDVVLDDDIDVVSAYLVELAKLNGKYNNISDIIENRLISTTSKMHSGGRDRFRELIRLRDFHICQWCRKQWNTKDRRFDVHHINGTPEDTRRLGGNTDEMITLCHKCHLNIDKIKMPQRHKK